jgi:hypothetical protein
MYKLPHHNQPLVLKQGHQMELAGVKAKRQRKRLAAQKVGQRLKLLLILNTPYMTRVLTLQPSECPTCYSQNSKVVSAQPTLPPRNSCLHMPRNRGTHFLLPLLRRPRLESPSDEIKSSCMHVPAVCFDPFVAGTVAVGNRLRAGYHIQPMHSLWTTKRPMYAQLVPTQQSSNL